MTRSKPFLVVLLVLNLLVLVGQVWPEGAPPFGHMVNVVTLVLDVVLLLRLMTRH